MQKNWFTVFNVKVTVMAYSNNKNMTICIVSSKLLVGLQPNLVWYYSIVSQSVLWKKGITAFKVRSQERFKMSGNVCPDDIFSMCPIVSAQYLLNCSTIFCVCAELGMVVYYHEVICHAQKLVHSLECQGHSEGLNIENVTFSSISSKLLVCLQPNMV